MADRGDDFINGEGAPDGVGEARAAKNDCDTSERRRDARFWDLVNASPFWISSHLRPTLEPTLPIHADTGVGNDATGEFIRAMDAGRGLTFPVVGKLSKCFLASRDSGEGDSGERANVWVTSCDRLLISFTDCAV